MKADKELLKLTQLPSRPFTESELMQKPRPSFVTVIRGSKVNHFNLENYDQKEKPTHNPDR